MHHITSKWTYIGQCIGLSLLEPVLHGFEVHASADLLSCAVHVNNHTNLLNILTRIISRHATPNRDLCFFHK